MELSLSYLSALTSKAESFILQYRVPLATILSLSILGTAYVDYSGWYNLGKGGLPYNVLGWGIQNLLRLRASKDRRSTACYDALKTSDLESKSFLDGELPKRANPRIMPWTVPQRQIDDIPSERTREVSETILH